MSWVIRLKRHRTSGSHFHSHPAHNSHTLFGRTMPTSHNSSGGRYPTHTSLLASEVGPLLWQRSPPSPPAAAAGRGAARTRAAMGRPRGEQARPRVVGSVGPRRAGRLVLQGRGAARVRGRPGRQAGAGGGIGQGGLDRLGHGLGHGAADAAGDRLPHLIGQGLEGAAQLAVRCLERAGIHQARALAPSPYRQMHGKRGLPAARSVTDVRETAPRRGERAPGWRFAPPQRPLTPTASPPKRARGASRSASYRPPLDFRGLTTKPPRCWGR